MAAEPGRQAGVRGAAEGRLHGFGSGRCSPGHPRVLSCLAMRPGAAPGGSAACRLRGEHRKGTSVQPVWRVFCVPGLVPSLSHVLLTEPLRILRERQRGPSCFSRLGGHPAGGQRPGLEAWALPGGPPRAQGPRFQAPCPGRPPCSPALAQWPPCTCAVPKISWVNLRSISQEPSAWWETRMIYFKNNTSRVCFDSGCVPGNVTAK